MNNQVQGFDPDIMPVDIQDFNNYFSDEEIRRDILNIINQMINLNQCEDDIGPEEYMNWRDRIMAMVNNLSDQYTERGMPEMIDIPCHDANNNNVNNNGAMAQLMGNLGYVAPQYNANPVPNHGEVRYLPPGLKNAMTNTNIAEGNDMVNFGSEYANDRYHLRSSYNQFKTLPNGRKENPYSRQPINDAVAYRATLEVPPLEGGTRKRRGVKKHRRRRTVRR